jgi:hypothetical protein
MGASQSSSVTQVNDILNESITEIVNQNTTSASARNTNVNSFTLKNGPTGKIINCNFNLGQKINATQAVKVMAKITSTQELANTLNSAVDTAMEKNQESVNGFLSTAFTNQESTTDIKNILKNTIQNNITNTNLTECNAILDNANNGLIENDGLIDCSEGGQINNPQEIISDQLVMCFSEALTEALLKNENISKAKTTLEESQTSKNTGLDGVISAIFSMWGIIGIVVIVVVIGVILYFANTAKAVAKTAVSAATLGAVSSGRIRIANFDKMIKKMLR